MDHSVILNGYYQQINNSGGGGDTQTGQSNIMKLIMIVVIVYIFIFLAGIVLITSGRKTIRNNWVKYRCNPLIMPFANFFGKDPNETMKVCSGIVAKQQSETQLSPFKSQLFGTLDILKKFGTIFQTLRTRASTFRALLLGIFETLYLKMQTLGTMVQYSLVKTNEIMRKNYGLFVISMRSALAVYETFKSIMNGPIGKVSGFLCFEENTLITMKNNELKKIKHCKIGDRLINDNAIIGAMIFDAQNIELYHYNSIIVSGSHLVFENEKWIRVEDSKNAKKIKNHNITKIYCLNTLNNTIDINGILFRDYIELSNVYTNYKMKQYILTHLNKQEYTKDIAIGDGYMLGFSSETKIRMKNGDSVAIQQLKIGDETINGIITGTIHLLNNKNIYSDGNNYFSEHNIVKNQWEENPVYTWDLVSNVNHFTQYRRTFRSLYHICTEEGIVTLDNGLQFTDFEESSDTYVNIKIDRMIESFL